PDQNLHDALTDIREDGRIPWDWIVDAAWITGVVVERAGFAKQGVLAKLPYIKLDPWRDLAPMILTEARSVAGVLPPFAKSSAIPVKSNFFIVNLLQAIPNV